jgi:hypothetical protein
MLVKIWRLVTIMLTALSMGTALCHLLEMPADWMRLRNQWEYTHAARAVLQIVALGALVFSILVEIPTNGSSQPTSALPRIARSAPRW